MPSFPTVNNKFWLLSSTSTRSNTTSRSSVSAGACWKCQASLPVSTSNAIADRRLPYGLAGSRVERDQVRLAGRRKQFVAMNRNATHGGGVRVRAIPVFPDQIARAAIERLHDVPGVVQIDDPVVHERRGLIPSALVH